MSALTAAQILPLVQSLPDGLDTVVGDRGYRLSGGEKQRIAIARLLLKAPDVVVLDEATAHLDSESELAVQKALKLALAGRTSIVIAHRLSTVREANRIVVVEGGHIVEQGRHEELLAQGGLYAELYETQFAQQAGLTPPFLRRGGRRHAGRGIRRSTGRRRGSRFLSSHFASPSVLHPHSQGPEQLGPVPSPGDGDRAQHLQSVHTALRGGGTEPARTGTHEDDGVYTSRPAVAMAGLRPAHARLLRPRLPRPHGAVPVVRLRPRHCRRPPRRGVRGLASSPSAPPTPRLTPTGCLTPSSVFRRRHSVAPHRCPSCPARSLR